MKRRHGATLISCLIAMTIVGVGIPAVLGLATACTSSNTQSAQTTQAISLANNVLEFGLLLPMTDPGETFVRPAGEIPPNCSNLYGLDGWTFNPPIDSGGHAITALPGWEQHCTVTSFEVLDPGAAVPPSNTNVRILKVEVSYRGGVVHSASRIMAPTIGLNP